MISKRRATGMRRMRSRTPAGRAPSTTSRAAATNKKFKLSKSLWGPRQIVWAKRSVTLPELYIPPTPSPPFGFQYSFKLDDLPAVGDFSSLFDAYRINKVVLRFRSIQTQQLGGTGSVGDFVPRIYITPDYDAETSVPSGAAQVQQYSTCKSYPVTKDFTMALVPKTAVPVYRTSLVAAYAEGKPRLWLDCNYLDVPHYGVIGWVQAGQTSFVYRYSVEAVYYIALKNMK